MFNGIVEDTGIVKEIRKLEGNGLEFDISWSKSSELGIDDSIAINGACQTVVHKTDDYFTVQAVEETLRKTNFGEFKIDDYVNLERSLTLNARMDGHMVQGHVDTTAEILNLDKEGTNWLIRIALDSSFKNLVVGRGSITLDGISLTVARDEGDSFVVAIIPYTYEHTVLKYRNPGDLVNVEFDVIGKYVIKYMENLNN